MLANLEVHPTIPAADIHRARRFYADKLGLEPEKEFPDGGLLYQVKNGAFLLYPTQYAGTAKNTAMEFRTDNVERDVKELRSKGVVFEEYDMPGLKTVNGIATMGGIKGAWLRIVKGIS